MPDNVEKMTTNYSPNFDSNKRNKNKIPSRMSRIAFPKAKYGVYLAVIFILLVLIILYKDSITLQISILIKEIKIK